MGTLINQQERNQRVRKAKKNGLVTKRKKEYREYGLFSQGSEIICKVQIEKKEIEALIDAGSEVSLMKLATCEELKLVIDSLEESDLIITQANGQEMQLKGIYWLPVEIWGMSTWSKFYIASNLDRAMILREDWPKKDQAQIRFKPKYFHYKRRKNTTG